MDYGMMILIWMMLGVVAAIWMIAKDVRAIEERLNTISNESEYAKLLMMDVYDDMEAVKGNLEAGKLAEIGEIDGK